MDLTKITVPDLPPQDPPALFAAFAEAPGQHEMKAKKPLVPHAPGGKMWNRLLFTCGILRRQLHIGNFCHTQLPGNDTSKLWKVTDKGNFKTAEGWDTLVQRFRETIRNLDTDRVLLLGDTPLVGLFGPDYLSLASIRGYPLHWEGKLIIPTHHPASMLPRRSPSNFWLSYFDIHKLFRIGQHGREKTPYALWIPGRNQVCETL